MKSLSMVAVLCVALWVHSNSAIAEQSLVEREFWLPLNRPLQLTEPQAAVYEKQLQTFLSQEGIDFPAGASIELVQNVHDVAMLPDRLRVVNSTRNLSAIEVLLARCRGQLVETTVQLMCSQTEGSFSQQAKRSPPNSVESNDAATERSDEHVIAAFTILGKSGVESTVEFEKTAAHGEQGPPLLCSAKINILPDLSHNDQTIGIIVQAAFGLLDSSQAKQGSDLRRLSIESDIRIQIESEVCIFEQQVPGSQGLDHWEYLKIRSQLRDNRGNAGCAFPLPPNDEDVDFAPAPQSIGVGIDSGYR